MRRALPERLAENGQVIIIDSPVSLLRDRKSPTLKVRWDRLPGIEDCCHYRPLHYPERFPWLGKMLGLLNRYRLLQEIDQLLPDKARRIVCFDSPNQDHLVGKLKEETSIYLAIDDRTLTVTGKPINGELAAEKRLLSKVDKVLCVSETLANVLRSRVPNGRTLSIEALPNGYNERIFDPGKNYLEPLDLTHVPKPRVLVAGHISERIDWEGIKGAVKSRPSWTWVFVGPADAGMVERINTISGSAFYHPPVPVEEVPAWIRYCDACAVPYRLNPFTRASSPLKAIEFLAMEAPVLSTRIPALQPYGDVIHWIDEGYGESYALGLDEALSEKTDSVRMKARCMAVGNDSWAKKAEAFKALVLNA
jgi:hypothetical protein